jgi:D-alanine--poly(phosphoribitol) ligase subunit 1
MMSFVKRLQESLENHKERPAFFIDGDFYTYGDLEKKVANIRQVLRQRIPASEKLVGLVTHNDLETYSSILALWLEGKAYVPINPINPVERNAQILDMTGSTYLLDSSEKSVYSPYFEILDSKNLLGPVVNLSSVPYIQEDLAYILFTSGSTGTPKGVPITFDNLNSLVSALDSDPLFELNDRDKCLQMFELTFDFSLVAYLPPLLAGACVYTLPKNSIKYLQIFKLIKEQQLTVLTMVPSIIHYLRPYFNEINGSSVRYCSFGGGKLFADIAEEWSHCIPNAEIFNYYGPTEFTVYSGYYPYQRGSHTKNHKGIISIGTVLKGVKYLIVDENNKEVPMGTTGELCLAGKQLTPGYWKNKKKNRTSFFTVLKKEKPVRYYKTGDLCFLDDEGDYMYVGRADFQVKIQGYRVELGDLEFHAKQLIANIEMVALDIDNGMGNKELALVLVAEPFDTAPLKNRLRGKLPAYMVPTQIRFFDELPHSVNGKVDRHMLKKLFTDKIDKKHNG